MGMKVRGWLPVVMIVALACGGGADETRFSPLTTDGAHFFDEQERLVLLRGVNARVEGVFDVTFDDGRLPVESIPPLTDADCQRMRSIGFNLLRLPLNWSGVEPVRGSYSETYLSAVDEAVKCAADAGLYVLLDLHQDAYSKEIGEDGAPLWAIVPEPAMLLEGPLEDLEARRTSEQVARAFESFFDAQDRYGLQADFIAMLQIVASRFAQHPRVVGIEIFNEPVISAQLLDPFHAAAAAAIREVAPEKLIFFEPPAIRNFLDFQPLSGAPFPVTGAVYSPHIYTFVFGDGEASLAVLTRESLRPSIDNARAEAITWGTPLFIGEFGIGPNMTNADLWMGYQSELHDEYLASSAFWVWKEDSQDSWGVYARDGDVWVERPQVVAWVSRVYPQRIAGYGPTTSLVFDSSTGVMSLSRAGPGSHVVYVPEAASSTYRVTCDGQELDAPRDSLTGTIEPSCMGLLVVVP